MMTSTFFGFFFGFFLVNGVCISIHPSIHTWLLHYYVVTCRLDVPFIMAPLSGSLSFFGAMYFGPKYPGGYVLFSVHVPLDRTYHVSFFLFVCLFARSFVRSFCLI